MKCEGCQYDWLLIVTNSNLLSSSSLPEEDDPVQRREKLQTGKLGKNNSLISNNSYCTNIPILYLHNQGVSSGDPQVFGYSRLSRYAGGPQSPSMLKIKIVLTMLNQFELILMFTIYLSI